MVFARWCLALCVLAGALPAQNRVTDDNFHGWYNYFGDHPLGNSKWGLHLEGQFRRHDLVTKWQQLLLRPGVNYSVNPNIMLTGGYAYIRSHPYGDFPSPILTNEHRLWEQALFRYKTRKVSWTSRVRFENRFLETYSGQPVVKGHRYENRLRLWQSARVPLREKLYFTAYEEFWLYVKPYVSNSAFDQNRAFAGLGVEMAPHWRFEAGYMNQAILQRSGRVLESNHTLVIAIHSNAPFRGSQK